MEKIPRLYNTCLRQVSLFLKEGIWNSSEDPNPFSSMPVKIVDDLVSTTLRIQTFNGFRAEDLKLLLTSGILREFKIKNPACFCHELCSHDWSSSENLCGFRNMELEITQALKFLATASQNLEVLQLTHGGRERISSELSNALQELIRNSPKLKYIHSKFAFQLQVLRKCKQLKSIILHFIPEQPWYDFLEKNHRNEQGFQILNSLEIFTICRENWIKLSEEVVSEYIVILLKHCPSLISLGSLETSRALARLQIKGLPLKPLKLRYCHWRKGRWIRDAVTCHPLVDELILSTRCVRSLEPLRNLRNLAFLSLWITVERDVTPQPQTVLKDIGIQLKGLNLVLSECTVDISLLLKYCPNLETLKFRSLRHSSYSEPAIYLPNLRHLFLTSFNGSMKRLLQLLSGCHSLTELELIRHGFDDEILDEFLKKNSFANLKIAYFENSDLTRQGFKKFLLNAPNLEKVYAMNEDRDLSNESELKKALIETNHKAVSTNFCVSNSDGAFHINSECNAWR